MENDLISRSALLKDIDESVVFSVRDNVPSAEIRGANKITERIKAAPAVDAVQVVRCVKCAWYSGEEHICTNSHCTKSYYGCRVRQDHFCSYGERRADDATD